jgi:hypothetical protein
MSEHVTIEHGHHVAIDAHGWVAQRVGDDLTELTASLHDWGRLQHLTYTSLDWITRAELWCQARGYDIAESGPMTHDHYRLSAPVTILLAVADDHGTIAIVSVDDAPPTVYRDITTDDGYWYQVDSLDIACGCGRRWTWTGNELIDADGTATTVAAVFGDSPHTPFTPCPDCAAHDDHPTDPPCPTPGADPILCPHCGQRCDLGLAAVATYPQQRPHAVQVTETVDYTGWVLAVDPDDADDQAHRLLAEGNQNPGIGHLDVIHRDVEVMANDARDTCWQCRTDPNVPHPACPHPAPHSSPAGRAANAGTPAPFDPDNRAYQRWQKLLDQHFHVLVWTIDGTGRPALVTMKDPDSGDAFTIAILDSAEVRDPHVLLTATAAAHLSAYGPFDGAQAAVTAAPRLTRARANIRATCPVPLHKPDEPSLPDSMWRAIPSALGGIQPAPDDAPRAALILLDRATWRVAAVGPFTDPAAAERWQPAGDPAAVDRLVIALQPAPPTEPAPAVL